eukprot:COSAG04_NODE_734_length_10713_cov_2.619748_3_plen_96_part_00
MPCRLFLGPWFRLGARWNRLVETVKTRKKREKTGGKWARYGLRSVNKERTGGINWSVLSNVLVVRGSQEDEYMLLCGPPLSALQAFAVAVSSLAH